MGGVLLPLVLVCAILLRYAATGVWNHPVLP